ncbi:MAG: SMC-Scp complex subunit ScpB [Thermoplasmata archaeon]|nr:SMC-Scp complex subunit ScpB [Thermoplasmata archaeon]
MPARTDPLELKLEAILFAGGAPLSVKELTDKAGETDFRAVQRALRHLVRAYSNRQTSLEIRRAGDRFALQVREEFLPSVHSVQPIEIPPRTLKALTLIAYHQPMLQSVLVKMVGESAYAEVAELQSFGLVHAEPKASTLQLTTTSRFAEYFGIGSSRPDQIREFLAKKLGLPALAEGGAPAPASDTEGPSVLPDRPVPPPVAPGETG